MVWAEVAMQIIASANTNHADERHSIGLLLEELSTLFPISVSFPHKLGQLQNHRTIF